LEILANDFLGWGTRFPWAKRKAAYLLSEHLPASRELLRDVYLCQRNYVRSQVVKAELSAPPDAVLTQADVASVLGYDPSDETKVVVTSSKSLAERLPSRQGAF
jgi:hypothetical protein